MVTDATRRYRDVLAIGLVAVAALYFVAALTMLFRSDPLFAGSGSGFADNAALSGYLFSSVLPVSALVVAVLLATRYGEVGPLTRVVVLAALGVAAVDLLFAVITFFAQLGSHLGYGFGGTLAGGTFSGVVLGLAQLVLLGLAALYLFTALRSLPAAAPAGQPGWGAPGQFGYPSGWQQQPAPGQPGPQASWPTAESPYGWGAPAAGQQPAWGAPGEQPGWGAPGAAAAWGSPSPGRPQGWHDPAAAQQGQPAWAWSQGGHEGDAPAAAAATAGWEQAQQQPVWEAPAGASEWRPGEDRAETTAVAEPEAPLSASTYAADAPETVEPHTEDQQPPEQPPEPSHEGHEEGGGWWRRSVT